MIRQDLLLPRTFRALQDIVREHWIGYAESLVFALTWMAAARMVLLGKVPGATRVDDLAREESWRELEATGLPVHGVKRWLPSGESGGEQARARAIDVVKDLVGDLGTRPWDVLPVFSLSVGTSKEGVDGALSAGVSELMLDMLGSPAGTLWIPFDRWGTLTIRAHRRGWKVNAAQMLGGQESTLPLLLAIECGEPTSPEVESVLDRDAQGMPLMRTENVLACPPFGVVVRDTRLVEWDSMGGRSNERFARSETWLVHELVNRCTSNALFLLPPGLLFTKGQEQRLREYLLLRGGERNELKSVVALPSGALSNINLATAIVHTTPGQHNENTRFVDLGLSRRAATNLDELLHKHWNLALGAEEDSARACSVTRDVMLNTEASFAPSRYLVKAVEIGPNAIALGDICELVRAPVMAREDEAVELLEVGIPDLGRWCEVSSGLEKTVRVKGRKGLPTLQQGDLVVSVKGTIGKTALMGSIASETAVVSQTCIALRLTRAQAAYLSPEFVLMYLRSKQGQAQLESLKAGSAVQHISPQSLLSSVRVPVPEREEVDAVERDYRQLCELERKVDVLSREIVTLAASRWGA